MLIAVGLLLIGTNLIVVDPTGVLPAWWSWVLALFVLAFGVVQVMLWDRRWSIRRFYRANASLLDVHVDDKLDDEMVQSVSSGSEGRWDWSQFSAVIECDDLLVLAMGDLARGGHWTAPRRGLEKQEEWPALVALAREHISGPYFRSSR